MNIAEWHDFFLAMAGAAATLAGLIFVGVSINMTRILSLPKLPDRALLSLFLLIAILIISAIMLIPGQSILTRGIELSIISLIHYVGITRLDVVIYKGTLDSFKKHYTKNIILNQLSTIPYLVASITTILSGEIGIYWTVPAIILSFIKSIIDAWVLLVEINR